MLKGMKLPFHNKIIYIGPYSRNLQTFVEIYFSNDSPRIVRKLCWKMRKCWFQHFLLFLQSFREPSSLLKEKMPVTTSIFSFFIRPSKTGRIMGSPVAGRRPVLCPEHISKTILARVMKFHGWIDLIQGECSAQES